MNLKTHESVTQTGLPGSYLADSAAPKTLQLCVVGLKSSSEETWWV